MTFFPWETCDSDIPAKDWNEAELTRARRACQGGRLAFLLCAALTVITIYRPGFSYGLFAVMALSTFALGLYTRLWIAPERQDARCDLHRIFEGVFQALIFPVLCCSAFLGHPETGTVYTLFVWLFCIFPFSMLAELGKTLRHTLFEDVVPRAVTASLWIFIPVAAIILISLLFISRALWLTLPLLMLTAAMLIFSNIMHGTYLRLSASPKELRQREENIQKIRHDPDLNAEDLHLMRKQRLLTTLMFALVLFLLFVFPSAKSFLVSHFGGTLTDFLPFILLLGIMFFNAGTTTELRCTIFASDHYERHQKCWLWQMFITFAISCLTTWYAIQISDSGLGSIMAILIWLYGIYTLTQTFLAGPDESYDDEGCREIRRHAIQLSWRVFPILAALIALSLYLCWRPHIAALWAGMWILTLYAALPVAVYAWLFYRASKGEEP